MTRKQIDFILELAERDGTYIEELVERFPQVNWAKARTRKEATFRKYQATLSPEKSRVSLHITDQIFKEIFLKGFMDNLYASSPLRGYLK